MTLSDKQLSTLEKYYLQNFPEQIPDDMLKGYNSIVENIDLIRSIQPNKRIFTYLLDAIFEKLRNKQRFQKIKLISLLRKHYDVSFIDNSTVYKLFFLFKSLITDINEASSWKLTVMIRDTELPEESIDWLINNFRASEHIQNRLLRYPKPHILITDWAHERLNNQDLPDRESELVGLILNFQPDFTIENKSSLLWGIHYSKLPEEMKKSLLVTNLVAENFEELLKICVKNDYLGILSQVYENLGLGGANNKQLTAV